METLEQKADRISIGDYLRGRRKGMRIGCTYGLVFALCLSAATYYFARPQSPQEKWRQVPFEWSPEYHPEPTRNIMLRRGNEYILLYMDNKGKVDAIDEGHYASEPKE